MPTQANWIRMNQRIQQLEKDLNDQVEYTENLRKIFTGNVETVSNVTKDESGKTIQVDTLTKVNRNEMDEALRQSLARDLNIENTGTQNPAEKQPKKSAPEGSFTNLHMVAPLKGIISAGFSEEKDHFGMDIAAPKNTPIKSVADGYVIIADWTMETGNTIGVQHGDNLITFYKHCASLLKKKGDVVKAGEAIAIIGNTGTQSTGPHLHFEMWHKGRALDPVRYVQFE
jgi:murein DD-endopeptidase MepM/ murein hydrolase activator NlpD